MLLKRCPTCKAEKPCTPDFFSRNRRTHDGFAAYCKSCASARYREFYEKNRAALIERSTEQSRRRRLERPEYDRNWSREYKRRILSDPVAYAAHLERNTRWREANPDRVALFKHSQKPYRAARTAARYARRRLATPKWVDLSAIRSIYEEAARITRETGIPHEVDHIVPLMGRMVCGLHVPWNLRIITGKANRKKSNRFAEEHTHLGSTDISPITGDFFCEF